MNLPNNRLVPFSSPKDRVVGPLPNGLFMACKSGFVTNVTNHLLTAIAMILQVFTANCSPNKSRVLKLHCAVQMSGLDFPNFP